MKNKIEVSVGDLATEEVAVAGEADIPVYDLEDWVRKLTEKHDFSKRPGQAHENGNMEHDIPRPVKLILRVRGRRRYEFREVVMPAGSQIVVFRKLGKQDSSKDGSRNSGPVGPLGDVAAVVYDGKPYLKRFMVKLFTSGVSALKYI